MEKRFRATLDIWIARIGTAFGWFWGVLYVLIAIVGFCELTDAKDNIDRVMPFVCIGLAAVHFLIVVKSRKTRELVNDFRYYALILAKDKSITALSKKVKEPPEQVEKKLLKMCKRGYFKGRVDLGQDRLVLLENSGEAYAAKCPGCGATTKIFKNGDICRYCGNPLVIGENITGMNGE